MRVFENSRVLPESRIITGTVLVILENKPNDLTSFLNILPSDPGAAIILDDNSERIYPIGVRPKLSWHGGEAPTAIKAEVNL